MRHTLVLFVYCLAVRLQASTNPLAGKNAALLFAMFIPLAVNDIAYIYSENKTAKIVAFDNRAFHESSSLDKLQRQLDPLKFFRANRQFIISHKAIKDISVWFDSKLSLNLSVDIPEKIIVSRIRASEFKDWYSGK